MCIPVNQKRSKIRCRQDVPFTYLVSHHSNSEEIKINLEVQVRSSPTATLAVNEICVVNTILQKFANYKPATLQNRTSTVIFYYEISNIFEHWRTSLLYNTHSSYILSRNNAQLTQTSCDQCHATKLELVTT